MNKKEEFKSFAKSHPELINYLNNHQDMSWQKFYEIYDIYGEDEATWQRYFKESNNVSNNMSFSDFLKNVDVNQVQEHIKTAQKALGLISDLTSKGAENISKIKGPISPRPLDKFFGD